STGGRSLGPSRYLAYSPERMEPYGSGVGERLERKPMGSSIALSGNGISRLPAASGRSGKVGPRTESTGCLGRNTPRIWRICSLPPVGRLRGGGAPTTFEPLPGSGTSGWTHSPEPERE